jgi:hypothetical protein
MDNPNNWIVCFWLLHMHRMSRLNHGLLNGYFLSRVLWGDTALLFLVEHS